MLKGDHLWELHLISQGGLPVGAMLAIGGMVWGTKGLPVEGQLSL